MHYDWDLHAAEQEFRRAIQQNPSYGTARQSYGHCLGCMGRFEEAFAELKHAIHLEPLALIIGTSYAGVSWLGRRWDQAIEQTKKTLDLDANFAPGLWALAKCHEGKGMHEFAIECAEDAVKLSGGNQVFFITDLGHAYASAGREKQAVEILAQLEIMGKHRYVDPCLVAHIYTALGEKENAFNCLEQALQTRSAWVVYLPMDPWFDPLREDPRFEDLLRRAGLPWRLGHSHKQEPLPTVM
jgi:tetratricopeptide (TPR) repeat protein